MHIILNSTHIKRTTTLSGKYLTEIWVDKMNWSMNKKAMNIWTEKLNIYELKKDNWDIEEIKPRYDYKK